MLYSHFRFVAVMTVTHCCQQAICHCNSPCKTAEKLRKIERQGDVGFTSSPWKLFVISTGRKLMVGIGGSVDVIL